MEWFVLIVFAIGALPVLGFMLWAFGKLIPLLHKEELSLQRRTRETEDRLFAEFMQNKDRTVISRGKAIILVLVATAMASWPFALIGWAVARHVGAVIGAVAVIPATVYAYVQIRGLPRRVERARKVRARHSSGP